VLKKYIKGRVAIFIDAANILYSQQTLGWQIDYEKLIDYFKTRTELVSAHFYSGTRSEKKNQTKFFKKMQSFGYTVTTKEVKWIKDNHGKILKGKGNLDIELALDMSSITPNYDTVILLSGDSDFAPLIQLVKRKKKKVIVISTKYHIAKELIDTCDKYINLKYLREFVERK
jgi:uncharacterized LabA/DUF88 family protein